MKLPSEPTIKSTTPVESGVKIRMPRVDAAQNSSNSNPVTTIKVSELSTEQANKLLQQLVNTWAKVESSHPLKPEQLASQQTAQKRADQEGTKPEGTRQDQSASDKQRQARASASNSKTSTQPPDSKTTKETPPNENTQQQNQKTLTGQDLLKRAVEQLIQLKTGSAQLKNQSINPQTANTNTQVQSNTPTTQAEVKVMLVKLNTEQGLINILSPKPYTKGADVFITQNASGTLQLQTPSQTFSLANMAAQLSGGKQSAPSIPLPNSWPLKNLLNMPPIPNSTINSQSAITPQSVQQAIQHSGQFFEHNLAQALKGIGKPASNLAQSSSPPSTATSGQTNAGTASSIAYSVKGENQIGAQLNERMQNLGQSLKQWGQQFGERFNTTGNHQQQTTSSVKGGAAPINPNTASNPSGSPLNIPKHLATPTEKTAARSQSNPQAKQSLFSQLLQAGKSEFVPKSTASTSTPTANTTAQTTASVQSDILKTVLQQDQKLWLQTGQSQLTQAFSQQLTQNKEAFVPNWSNLIGQLKTPLDLSNWLNLLVAPKPNLSDKGLSVWPANLSSQSQLHQTLSLLLANTPSDEQNALQQQTLRQLQALSQSLMKVQHDQLQTRLQPASGDQPAVQLNLPYVHQQQLQWAEFEYQPQPDQQQENKKTTGWHLILRFAQDTPEAFAIESQLKQEQTNIVLWATEKLQLKKLHEQIPTLRDKLIHAGFKIENISSKHGSPARLNQPIQQSLVDVRT